MTCVLFQNINDHWAAFISSNEKSYKVDNRGEYIQFTVDALYFSSATSAPHCFICIANGKI